MSERGEFGEAVVLGPISYDLATSTGVATIKGYDSPYAGDVDMFLVPADGHRQCDEQDLERRSGEHPGRAAWSALGYPWPHLEKRADERETLFPPVVQPADLSHRFGVDRYVIKHK